MEDLDLYILTFNCARNLIDVDRFAAQLFDVLPASAGEGSFGPPDLLVLSLQEIAPIAYAFLGGSYIAPYFDAFSQAVKKAVAKQWDKLYVNLVTEHTGMTGLMIFARADVTDRISWIDTAHVGFGVQEMGNKGAVGARLGYAVDGRPPTMDLTFVAAHLAPMEDGYEQRNLDWQSLVERLVFSPQEDTQQHTSNEGRTSDADESTALLHGHAASSVAHSRRDLFAPNTYLFVAGDLNYRTSNVGPAKGDVARFPRRDVDPSSPWHHSQLLKEDQLRREMRQGRSFHGLTEAPIDFPPTYKYSDVAREAARLGQGDKLLEWKWSSHRWPSWCDRILYLDDPSSAGNAGRVKAHVYNVLPLLPQSDHRPVALAVSVPLQPAQASPGAGRRGSEARSVAPFSIDPNWRQRRDAARRKEIAVGWAAYMGLTWEGNGMLLAFGVGLFGAWFALRSLLDA